MCRTIKNKSQQIIKRPELRRIEPRAKAEEEEKKKKATRANGISIEFHWVILLNGDGRRRVAR